MKLNEIAGGGKVWILFHDEPYEGGTLYGCFSSKSEAEKAKKEYMKDSDAEKYHLAIQEVIVNKLYDGFALLRD